MAVRCSFFKRTSMPLCDASIKNPMPGAVVRSPVDEAVAAFAATATTLLTVVAADERWHAVATSVVRVAAAAEVQTAIRAFARDDVEIGVSAMRRAIAIEPSRSGHLFILARQLFNAKRNEDVAAALTELANREEVGDDLLLGAARMEASLGRVPEGEALIRRALRPHELDDDLAWRGEWAIILVAAARYEAAAEALLPVADRARSSPKYGAMTCRVAHHARCQGTRLLAEGDKAHGLQKMRQATVLDPQNAFARIALAMDHVAAGRAEEALRQIDAIPLPTPCAELLALLGRVEADLGLTDRAIGHYREAVGCKGAASPQAWRVRLAKLLNTSRQADEALDALLPLSADPSAAPNHLAFLSRLLWRAGRRDEGLRAIDRALAAVTSAPPSWSAMRAEFAEAVSRGTPGGIELSASYMDGIYAGSAEYRVDAEESVYVPIWSVVADLIQNSFLRIIDAGCGPGQFASFLLPRRPKLGYLGIDFSKVAVAQARVRCPSARFLNADLLAGTLLADEPYDIFLALEVLEHIEHDRELLSKVRSGARVIVSVPDFDSFGHVRFFRSKEEVADRFGSLIEGLEVLPIKLAQNATIFLMHGVRR